MPTDLLLLLLRAVMDLVEQAIQGDLAAQNKLRDIVPSTLKSTVQRKIDEQALKNLP